MIVVDMDHRGVGARASLAILTGLLLVAAPLNVAAQDDGGEAPAEGEEVAEADEEVTASDEKGEGKDGKKKSAVQEQSAQEALAAGRPIVADDRPWTLSAGITTRVGQGTFVNVAPDPDAPEAVCPPGFEDCDPDNAYDRWSNFYSLAPSYTFNNFVLNGSVSWSHWLTDGGGANRPNEIRISDVSFDLFWFGKTIQKTGTNFSVDVGFSLPTSVFSQATSQIVDTFVVGIVRQPLMRRIFLTGAVIGGKTFHRYTTPVVDMAEVGEDNVLFRANGAEELGDGLVSIGGRNTEFVLSGNLTTSVIIAPKLTASVRYRYSRFWTYAGSIPAEGEDDPLRNPNAQGGRGVGDLSAGGVSLNYQVAPWMFLSGGISSSQPPKTSDQLSFRFPFWNFEGAAANRSAISLGARVIY